MFRTLESSHVIGHVRAGLAGKPGMAFTGTARNDHMAGQCTDEGCPRLPCQMFHAGERKGFDRGYAVGFRDGEAAGFSAGFSAGFAAGLAAAAKGG